MSDAPQLPSLIRRRRVPIACIRCRRRKIKVLFPNSVLDHRSRSNGLDLHLLQCHPSELGHPCTRCLKNNYECQYMTVAANANAVNDTSAEISQSNTPSEEKEVEPDQEMFPPSLPQVQATVGVNWNKILCNCNGNVCSRCSGVNQNDRPMPQFSNATTSSAPNKYLSTNRFLADTDDHGSTTHRNSRFQTHPLGASLPSGMEPTVPICPSSDPLYTHTSCGPQQAHMQYYYSDPPTALYSHYPTSTGDSNEVLDLGFLEYDLLDSLHDDSGTSEFATYDSNVLEASRFWSTEQF